MDISCYTSYASYFIPAIIVCASNYNLSFGCSNICTIAETKWHVKIMAKPEYKPAGILTSAWNIQLTGSVRWNGLVCMQNGIYVLISKHAYERDHFLLKNKPKKGNCEFGETMSNVSSSLFSIHWIVVFIILTM